MFDNELVEGITGSLVSLDERVGELERKENPAQSGIGPFEFEVHVDIAGGGDFTSVKAAADYVLATAGASEYWTIVVHAGDYSTETPFELPANTALVGIGNAFIFSASTSGTFITLAGNCTIRNITLTLNMNPTSVDCWAVECSGYVVLENCTFYVSRSGGSGSSQAIGVVKSETGDINNCWLRLYVQESSYPGQRTIVYFYDTSPVQESYLRDCTLGFAIEGSVVDDTSSTVYAEGHLLWVIDCVIQMRSSAQAGYDIEAGTGATIYTSGTLYVKSTGTVINLDTAAGAIGTVTSVAMTVPSILSVAGSPITTAGTLAVTLATQAANLVFAGPATGAAAAPTFRALVADDIPALPASKITSGILATPRGGTGISNATGSLTFDGATTISGGGTLALGGFAFTIPATGTAIIGGGSGAAGRVPIFSDANTLTSDAGLTYSTISALLKITKQALVGSQVSITEAYNGFSGDDCAVVEINRNVAISGEGSYSVLSLSHEQEGTDAVVGSIFWLNREIAGNDKRLAMIEVYTANDGTNYGKMRFATMNAGTALLRGTISEDGVLLWGKDTGLTSAGAVDIAGALNVDGSYTGKLTVATATTITGGGTLALAGFTLTVPATGTAALGTGTANRLTFWSGTNTLSSSADLLIDTTTFAKIGVGITPTAMIHGKLTEGAATLGKYLLRLEYDDGTDSGFFGIVDAAGTGFLPAFEFASSGVAGFGASLQGRIPAGNDSLVAGVGAFVFDGRQGSTGATALTAANIFVIRNGATAKLTLDKDGQLGLGVAPAVVLHILKASALTNTAQEILRIDHNTSGTAAAGFGTRILYRLESSTTADRDAVALDAVWGTATDASRSGYLSVKVVQAAAALAEAARFDKSATATHTGLMLWDADNATVERVTVGAADSGGTGFKVLRIPN